MEKDNNISLNKKKYKVQSDVEVAFARLIGPLAIISVLDSYNEDHQEIKKLLKIVVDWGANFQEKGNLNFINSTELLNIYNRLESIKDKYLYNDKIGNESELSDEIVIWMWEIMRLRKILIEFEGEN
ncbi:MAG: hypothetical protein ACI310_02410 [Bacilli bacterium]